MALVPSCRLTVQSLHILPTNAKIYMLLLMMMMMISTSASFVASAGSSQAACAANSRAADIRCGPRVRIISVGKAARDEPWVSTAIEVFTTRMRGTLDVECAFVKDDAALTAAVSKCAGGGGDGGSVIILDERGAMTTSTHFAERLYSGLEQGGSRLNFFVGGAEGLPMELKADRSRLLSLSSLTFPHQVARLLLVEQIYRATEIRKGSGYHKD